MYSINNTGGPFIYNSIIIDHEKDLFVLVHIRNCINKQTLGVKTRYTYTEAAVQFRERKGMIWKKRNF